MKAFWQTGFLSASKQVSVPTLKKLKKCMYCVLACLVTIGQLNKPSNLSKIAKKQRQQQLIKRALQSRDTIIAPSIFETDFSY